MLKEIFTEEILKEILKEIADKLVKDRKDKGIEDRISRSEDRISK